MGDPHEGEYRPIVRVAFYASIVLILRPCAGDDAHTVPDRHTRGEPDGPRPGRPERRLAQGLVRLFEACDGDVG